MSSSSSSPHRPVLELKNVSRSFVQGDAHLSVLKNANLTINKGEIVALIGPSGAGKSTLLHIAGLLEAPDSGDVVIDGINARSATDKQRTRMRREHIGFVYQFHHLLPEFTALENVAMPQRVKLIKPNEANARATQLLSDLGLSQRLSHQPMQLSGGEQQRVAIARALANKPQILLADEPTGNLDPETSGAVFRNLIDLVRKEGLAALIATHNHDLARLMDRTLQLVNGHIDNFRFAAPATAPATETVEAVEPATPLSAKPPASDNQTDIEPNTEPGDPDAP